MQHNTTELKISQLIEIRLESGCEVLVTNPVENRILTTRAAGFVSYVKMRPEKRGGGCLIDDLPEPGEVAFLLDPPKIKRAKLFLKIEPV